MCPHIQQLRWAVEGPAQHPHFMHRSGGCRQMLSVVRWRPAFLGPQAGLQVPQVLTKSSENPLRTPRERPQRQSHHLPPLPVPTPHSSGITPRPAACKWGTLTKAIQLRWFKATQLSSTSRT